MLQIRLSKPANETGGALKSVPVDTITVACPDHLVLSDLPVAKGLGSASADAIIKTVGRRSRRQLAERVHFCVRCDFPIAVYGRLSPCEHAFCLDCARSDSLCYLCDERIQKIQTIKMMEGIFVCAAPHCLKSFLKKEEFESHINETHTDILHPDKEKDGNESEAISARKYSASDSTIPNSNSQGHDLDDKSQRSQQPPSRPFPGQFPNHPSEQQPGSHNRFPQQSFDPRGLAPQFGTQQFFGAPYEIPRTDSTQETGTEQRQLSGFPTGPITFPQNYSRPWNIGLGTVPLEPPMVSQGVFMNVDPQGRGFFQGNYGQNLGILGANKGIEGGNFMDLREGNIISASQTSTLPPPPAIPPPAHLLQQRRGRMGYSGDENHDAAPSGFG